MFFHRDNRAVVFSFVHECICEVSCILVPIVTREAILDCQTPDTIIPSVQGKKRQANISLDDESLVLVSWHPGRNTAEVGSNKVLQFFEIATRPVFSLPVMLER
jgi:hypothetical protein